MTNGKLFYDDEFQALRNVIESSEFTYQQVAGHLFPDMKIESAYAKLKNCVKADGDERLKFGQIIAMCRFCKRFDALYHMADELSHDRPTERTPESQQDLILKEIAGHFAYIKTLGKSLERINPALKVSE